MKEKSQYIVEILKDISQWLLQINQLAKKWLLCNIEIDMLFHYIFGIWAALLGSFFNNQSLGIIIITLIVAIGKELFDLWDYGFFSWKDVLSTCVGGCTILIYTALEG